MLGSIFSTSCLTDVPKVNCLILMPRSQDMHIIGTIIVTVSFLSAHALPMENIGSYQNPAPRLQFLWLPLDVNCICSRFQACFFPNEEEFLVLVLEVRVGNQSVRRRRRGRGPTNCPFLLNLLLSV